MNSIGIFPNEEQKSLLISGAYDTVIKLWDFRQRDSPASFKGHTAQINCVQVSPDGKYLASSSHDGTVKFWDIGQCAKPMVTFTQHDAPVTCLKYNPVDKALASGGNDRTVKYWDLDTMVMVSCVILIGYALLVPVDLQHQARCNPHTVHHLRPRWQVRLLGRA